MKESIQRWIGQAEHDFENARKTLEIDLYDLSIISCQQSAEKILKALYIQLKSEEPPRIHSIRKLMELTDIPVEMLEVVADLDGYYLALRYPDVSELMPYENCTREDAELAFEKTGQILKLIKTKIVELQNEEENNRQKGQ